MHTDWDLCGSDNLRTNKVEFRENHIWKKTWTRACQAFASDQEVSVVKVGALLLLPLAPSVGVGIPPPNRLNF